MTNSTLLINDFSRQQQLPDYYASMAEQWFLPLAKQLAHIQSAKSETLLIGINGCQGSGKSTLAALLALLFEKHFQKKSISLSIDDFYLTRAERAQLAQDIHPLFITRGVPGTHDIPLLQTTLDQLITGKIPTNIPRFDKASDDRHPLDQWDTVTSDCDIIILEGWCVGAQAQDNEQLLAPVNTLEQEEDNNCLWRNYSNQQLQHNYQTIFQRLDKLVQLKAPSFDCVFQWRKQQEEQLKINASHHNNAIMNTKQLTRFIDHYQRITEYNLELLSKKADWVFYLNKEHQITTMDTNA